jgi:N-acetyl-beta-hexosaminidase
LLALKPPLSGESKDAPALIPCPKKFDLSEGTFRHSGPIAFNVPASAGLDVQSVRLALSSLKLAEQSRPTPPDQGLRLILEDPGAGAGAPEAYMLLVEDQRISVKSRSSAGWRMGLRTLAQLAGEGAVPQCRVVDWPDMAMRSAHLCYHLVRESLPYNAPNFEGVLEQIDQLAALKYNAVLLELESLFPYQKHPRIPCKIAFTQKQVAAIRDRLQAHGMEIVPMV